MWIPSYLINIKNNPNPFFFFNLKESSLRDKIFALYLRESSDFFRLHSDFVIGILVCILVGFTNTKAAIVCGVVGMISLAAMSYGAVITHIFKRMTALKSDMDFAKVGLVLAKGWKYVILLLIVLIFGLFYFISYQASLLLLQYDISRILIIAVLILLIPVTFLKPRSFRYYVFRMTTFSGILHIWNSFKRGNRYNFVLDKSEEFYENKNIYEDLELKTKPNILVLCVESYGSINVRDEELRESNRNTLSTFDEKLKSNNLFVASGLSIPPLFAGGSWLSYSTLLFGIRIDDTSLYNILFKNNKSFEKYKSLFRWTKSKGYTNFLINPLGGGYEKDIDWSTVDKNFSADHCLDWNAFDFQGKVFKFMDVGYCPPDQFTLNRSNELIKDRLKEEGKNEEPYANFFITLNTHFPYSSPEHIVDDWKELNTDIDYSETGNEKTNLKDKYRRAIKYQLEFISDYIKKNDDGNTIYLLFGDHQPPMITDDKMGLETPIHVIAPNEKLLQPFLEQGFEKGMSIQNTKGNRIWHEGFLSLFMQGLNSAYGQNPDKKYPYLPSGIVFKEDVN